MDIYHQILSDDWGYSSFRPLQEDIIHSIADGKDTLGLMPTGGGKSITFQVPALAVEGICIVVTPLIALMKDQVDNLKRKRIKATAVYSGMDSVEILTQLENCIFGGYKFLYVSPERLSSELFRAKLREMNVSFIAVDECHCISQWGYDFRPSYLAIADIRELLPNAPILALTATATTKTVDDIQARLKFKKPNVFSISFQRSNLAYVVRQTDTKQDTILHILSRVPGTAIIYVRSRQRSAEIAYMLRKVGIEADFYHAGISNEEKNIRQERWKKGECRVMVATNAFGMGIDKPDVRLVIHVDMPGSLEEYFQEAGRAGRDGKKAYAVMMHSDTDVRTIKKRLSDEFPPKELIRKIYDNLGSYFQIAVGFGFESMHEFAIDDFCHRYHISVSQTHYALKLLELSGYIEYLEESAPASRLLFLVARDELYGLLQISKRNDDILQCILRTYTGIFTDYAFISEGLIASRTGYKQTEVYETLTSLSKRHIISYIPQRKVPRIIYSRSREDSCYLRIPTTAYEDRRQRFEQRISKALEYLTSNNRCRSRMLLDYFGETKSDACGQCDVCLSNKNAVSNNSGDCVDRADLILNAISELLGDQSLEVAKIIAALPFPADEIIAVIKGFIDSDERFVLEDGKLRISR
ncbi:MAG: RecQ family ATP-dependent DNA helicase [Tannerellaceae bacterium]|jgi:ATP-dependent DNA helicase RecQ|nr:RecQ family ATP-dependent DNA helicase [Tannerellaceae bacterium]